MRLPRGSTVVDFAYHVHTDVGNQMIGARVNGAPAPPSRPLANADVVDVTTQVREERGVCGGSGGG